MHLTGGPDGPPLAPRSDAGPRLDEWLAPFGLGAEVLAERAAHLGLARQGSVSAGGATRLLEAVDGWIALALPRPDDRDLLPALLGIDVDLDDDLGAWTRVASAVRMRGASELVAWAVELGLAAAVVGEGASPVAVVGGARPGADPERPITLVDLSGLWAGPLCGHLLGRVGARVVKVESTRRPDGARSGDAGFFDLLNAGKASVTFDHATTAGRAELRSLVEVADVVISSSRARAIEQLGLDPDAFLAAGTDRVWVAITGHGWASNRVGFGDDAAAAAGLVAWGDDGRPRFAADAIADPLCGALAAAHALRCWQQGGRWFVDVSLAGAAAEVVIGDGRVPARAAERGADGEWQVDGVSVAAPVARSAAGTARPLGADRDEWVGST